MKTRLFITAVLLSVYSIVFGQTGNINGMVTDAISQEELIGVNIQYASGKGTVTNVNGKYTVQLPYGSYTFKVSYVGYETIEKTVVLNKADMEINFELKTKMLKEVEVIGDLAKTRETPVAFSNVLPAVLEEELAAQDLPMILNRTPGVYATQQGGGDGDARINIRGFNQRNVAVMIDGIPVNDMENGWVYWSNWFGLDAVTRSIQVQRGLGASKLALPSIGGTMNIMTKGIESKKSISLKQELGEAGFTRTSLALNSGKLKGNWSLSFAGSYKQGNGWVDATQTKGFFYYLRVDKEIKNHLISFTGFGAPQQHGQRAYKKSIASFDLDYAKEVGITAGDYAQGQPTDLGARYNGNWGWLTRTAEGETSPSAVNEKLNYFHKPQFSLRDFWSISRNFQWSNIIYTSIGSGGGTGMSTLAPTSEGLVPFQSVYNENIKWNSDTTGPTGPKGRGNYLYSSINNHFWVGLLSTFNWNVSQNFEVSGGIDLRDYTGQHYRVAYDLLGMEYVKDTGLVDLTSSNIYHEKDDIIAYHNDGKVRWGGVFLQGKYQKGNWSMFINLTGAYTGYQRIDYFKKKDLVIDGVVYSQAVGYQLDKKFVFPIGYQYIVNPDTFFVNGNPYTINSSEARAATTPWKYIPGFTVKGGVNYNISESMNVFANLGYLSKAPRFANVFDNSNREYREINNEKITAFEIGYSYFDSKMSFDLNAYYTSWKDKPADRASSVVIDEIRYSVNINGMDAIHMGVEAEFFFEISKKLTSETAISIGDWRWNSSDSAEIVDDNGALKGMVYFNAKGIKVGDAAQSQFRYGLRYQVFKGLYVKGSWTWFGNYYSEFDPLSLDPVTNPSAFDSEGNPLQSWKIPDYQLFDLGAGYNFHFKKVKLDLRVNVLNVFNTVYISDATNNDSYSTSFKTFDSKAAGVFFGMGRRVVTSLSMYF